MELFKIKSSIDERASALTYHISTVSAAFSGHIVRNYGLTYQEHMKRRPQPQPNIWIAEKYKENFIMPKPLDGSSME